MIQWLARLGFWIGLIASLGGVFAFWEPSADRLNHARLVTLLAAIVLLAVTWRGAKPYRRGIALLIPLNLALMAGPAYLTAAERAPVGAYSPDKVLKLISFNVWTENKSPEAIVDFLLREQADVVVLLELRQSMADVILPKLAAAYPHREVCLGKGCGMALLSRTRFETAASQRRQDGMPLVAAYIADRRVNAFGVHLQRPDKAATQANELRLLDAAVKAPGKPLTPAIVVAGDFNMTPWSLLMARFLRETRLRRHGTLHRSWPSGAWRPPLFLIDHVITSPDIKTISIETGPHLGSDHRPIIARLLLP